MENKEKENSVNARFYINGVLRKMKEFLNIKTDIELSGILGVMPNTISTWKARDSMDYKRLITVCKLYGIDLNALFSNTGYKQKNYEDIVIIPAEYQYSYVKGLYEQAFIQSMPRGDFISVVSDKTRAFQVVDISTLSTFKGNPYVLGEFVEDIKDVVTGLVYVFVNAGHGVFIGRAELNEDMPEVVYLINEDNKETQCKLKMFVKEIIEIWRVTNLTFDNITMERTPGYNSKDSVFRYGRKHKYVKK